MYGRYNLNKDYMWLLSSSNIILLLPLILIIIIDRYLCPNDACIIGWWCSTPCKDAKETLDYVPICFISLPCICCCCPSSGVFSFNYPPLFLHPIPIRLLRRRRYLPCPFQVNSPCYHHFIPACAPRFLIAALHRSIISRVSIYCATVFCIRQM